MQKQMQARMPYDNEIDKIKRQCELDVLKVRIAMAEDPQVEEDKRGDVKVRDWAQQNKYIISSFAESWHPFQPWSGFPLLLQKAPDYIIYRDEKKKYKCELIEMKEAFGPGSINIREDALDSYYFWNCLFSACRFFFYDWPTHRYCLYSFQFIFDLIDKNDFNRHTYEDGNTVIEIPKVFLEWKEGI